MAHFENKLIKKFQQLLLILLLFIYIYGCAPALEEKQFQPPETVLSDNPCLYSESVGARSQGYLYKQDNTQWYYYINGDNNNESLPANWRNWWYVYLNGVPVDREISFTVYNGGWPLYYMPVYSYDEVNWYRLDESEVSELEGYTWHILKKFEKPAVWLARFYPYSTNDLNKYLTKIKSNVNVRLSAIGKTRQNHPICMITITDFTNPDVNKKRVWIHARTHPGETPPSFLLEGLIDYLLANTTDSKTALSKLIFTIVPMQNVDGVMAGNYRSNTDGDNLEVMWYYDPYNPSQIDAGSPLEVVALHETIQRLISSGPQFTIALNLHSANTSANRHAFFITHFGPTTRGYSDMESSLWRKQVKFMNNVAYYYGAQFIEPPARDGGRDFLNREYPEKWWWASQKDSVMAITMETTYGRAGNRHNWITPQDLYELGIATAKAIVDYNNSLK
ncbi:MAG: M14-type cytosolic carboxypeptidase [Candidatus Magnetoovum sp. WYHC-5]|nr:M14-type cytosolic carboxypeptidase [Candidatus Magnetoovum sp. WYHC-5]